MLLPSRLPSYLSHKVVTTLTNCKSVGARLHQCLLQAMHPTEIREPNEVLIIKFNSCLLLPLRWEVDLFYNTSLDKAFLWALVVEIKVAPPIRYPPNRNPTNNPPPSHSQPYSSSSSGTKNTVWCNFHKTNSHNSADYRAIKNSHPHQTLFAEATPTEFPKKP
jgi:hypothetical protein